MPENTDKACGTADAPSTAVADLRDRLLAVDGGWELKDSEMAELRLQHAGVTVAYLVQRKGDTDRVTARYRQHGFAGPHLQRQAPEALVPYLVGEADRLHAKAGAPTDLAKALAALAKPKRAPRKRASK